jgi:DNA-binding response OmpR family regulator
MTRGRRILVVDDQQEILELVTSLLTAEGYDVETAGCGEDAVERLGERPFDLVLLDINMPGMDGWEALRLIRADEQLARLPVAMFSVKGEMQHKIHGMQEGAVDFITKPFTVEELLGRVSVLLRPESDGGTGRFVSGPPS